MTCNSSLSILIAIAFCCTGRSNPPELTYSSPLAVAPGQTTELVFHGKNLEEATQVWTGFSAETTLIPTTMDGKSCHAAVKVPSDVAVGIYAARIASVTGVSHPMMLMVDDLPSLSEVGKNHSRETAQIVLSPKAVDGAGDGVESDFYCIDAAQGQWLTIEVVASRLGYSFDAILRVLDEKGRELAVVDDTPGLNGDCWIRFQSTQQQRYFIEVYDATYSSSARHKYRLRVGDYPLVTSALAGAERLVSSLPNMRLIESQSNNSKESSLVVEAPTTIRSDFRKAGDTYYYRLPLTSGSRRRICGITRSMGSPADLLIKAFAPDGTLISTTDDSGLDEASFELHAKMDGEYLLCVHEINGRYGSDYSFRVEVTESQPSFELSAKGERVIIGQGGIGLLPVVCKRSGYDGPITLRIDDSAAPYRLEDNVIKTGQNKTLLKIVPSGDLMPGNLRMIRITGDGEGEGVVVSRRVSFVDEVRLLSPSLAYPPAELWDQLAVSIAKPLPEFFGLRLASNQVLFPRIVRELYYTVYCVDRIDGYSEAIHVEAELPNGFTTSGNDKPVGNSKNNEYRFELRGPAELPLGKHRISISAIGSFQGQTKEVKISEIPFHVIDPLIVSLELSNSDSKPGKVAIRVKATRFVPRAGGDRREIICKWKNRPAWLSGPESFIVAAGKNEAVLRMSVIESKDHSDRVGQLVLIAETSVSDQTVQVESEPFELRYPAPDETK